MAIDLTDAFVAAERGRWYIVVNEDHQSLGDDGESVYPGMTSRIVGSDKGYDTYHAADQALYELRQAR